MKRNSLNSPLDFLLFDKPDWTGREIEDWDKFRQEPWTIFRPGSEAEQEAKKQILDRRANPGPRQTRRTRSVYNHITKECKKVSLEEFTELLKTDDWHSGDKVMMKNSLHYIMNPEIKGWSSCHITKELPEGWIKGLPVDPKGYTRLSIKK